MCRRHWADVALSIIGVRVERETMAADDSTNKEYIYCEKKGDQTPYLGGTMFDRVELMPSWVTNCVRSGNWGGRRIGQSLSRCSDRRVRRTLWEIGLNAAQRSRKIRVLM